MSAEIGRRAHPVEDERVGFRALGHIIRMTTRVDESRLALLQLREKRPEPIRMLVVRRLRAETQAVEMREAVGLSGCARMLELAVWGHEDDSAALAALRRELEKDCASG